MISIEFLDVFDKQKKTCKVFSKMNVYKRDIL